MSIVILIVVGVVCIMAVKSIEKARIQKLENDVYKEELDVYRGQLREEKQRLEEGQKLWEKQSRP